MTTLNNYSQVTDFNKLEKIGEGTYGIVYKAEDKRTGQIVAMKKIRLGITEEGIPSTSLREISVLKEISMHPNVVKLIEVLWPHKGKLYLIFEYMLMDLRKYMDRIKGPLDDMLIVSYTYQVLRALDFCHSRRIIHRDLKPQNLLIDSAGLIKIADFGLARAVGIPVRVYTHEVVTMWYRCPEVLLGIRRYSHQIDMWSIGCIFGEMLTKTPLYRGDSEIDQLFCIFRIMGTPTSEEWPELDTLPDFKPTFPHWASSNLNEFMPQADYIAMDLFKRFVTYNPIKRINAKVALRHPYFRNFDSRLLPPAPPNYAVADELMNIIESDHETNDVTVDEEMASINHEIQNDSESFPIYNDEQDIHAEAGVER